MGLVAYHDYLENNPYYYQEAFSNMITQNHDQEQAAVHQQKESTQEQSDTNLPPKTSAQEQDKEQASDMTKEPVPAKPQVTIAIVGPEDVGIIMEKTTVDITEGSTVYGVLMQAAKAIKLPVESSGGDKKAYIEGINNIYEQDYGPASGWMYSVDGQFPGTSCGKYKLSGGEDIKFIYTLDMGKDVGAPAE